MPIVSILIPAYNTEKYIEQCVRSALNQTLTDIEVIVVNDGSTDSTRNILESLDGSDSRLKILHQENKGIGAARKRAFEEATGIYIQFVDSDDWIDDNYLKSVVEIAEDKRADIVETSGCYYHEENGTLTGRSSWPYIKNRTELNASEVAIKIVQRLHSCSLCTKLFRKEFCTKFGLNFIEGIDFGEDAHFICKVCSHNPKYWITPEVFYHLRNNLTSTTKTRYTIKKFNCRIAWIRDLDETIGNSNFKAALMSMKFFIKEEASLSRLFSQNEYMQIFPEVLNNLDLVVANPLRKLMVCFAVRFDNRSIGKIFGSRPMIFLNRGLNFIGRKMKRQ